MGVLGDLADEVGLDSGSNVQKGALATFLTAPAAFIVRIVLETFVLQPFAFALGTIDNWVGAAWASIVFAIRNPLQVAGETIRGVFLRPCGVEDKPCGLVPLYFESTAGTLTDAGVAAPVATSLANLLAVAILAMAAYWAITSLTGGTSTLGLEAARRLL